MGLSFLKYAVPLLALVCSGCAQMQVASDSSPPVPAVMQPPPDPQTQMAALEQRIEELIEEERLKINPAAKALTIDPQLVAIARQRSTDMAQKKYLANAGPDGKTS